MTYLYRFIGKNGSLGLYAGNLYEAVVDFDPSGPGGASIFLSSLPINIPGVPVPILPYIYCPYDSLEHFLENWQPQ